MDSENTPLRERAASSPPRAPLAFRVGVVGHRPHKLRDANLPALASLFRDVLTTVRDAVRTYALDQPSVYDGASPMLRVISPLAEGADRLFAEEALTVGYAICCPMPFFEEDFERDFVASAAEEPDSLERFHRLLDRARQGPGLMKFEMDGDRADPARAYAAAGSVVVNQSDLLVVVWDGRPPDGPGGTYGTLREALACGVPVVWVDAAGPHACQILRHGTDPPQPTDASPSRPTDQRASLTAQLVAIVRETLAPPSTTAGSHRDDNASSPRDLRTEYFRERRPVWHPWFLWKFLRDLLGDGRLSFQSLRLENFEQAATHDWPIAPEEVEGRTPSPIELWVNQRLRAHYAWADRLADLYADKYRSAFTLVYSLAALAVLLALLPVFVREVGFPTLTRIEVFAWLEGATMIVLLAVLATGRIRRWHDRWLDYRLVAELVRELRILLPLGGGRPTPRPPAHLSAYGDPARSWMFWHLNGIARATGLPDAKLSREHLQESVTYLRNVISGAANSAGQVRFHQGAARSSARIHHRLHVVTVFAFALTVACVAGHLIFEVFPGALDAARGTLLGDQWLEWIRPALWVGTAFLPAFGAAAAGLINQGEFARMAKRSEAMSERFLQIDGELQALERRMVLGQPVTSAEIAAQASRTAQLMVDEVLDWRVVFVHRPLAQP